MADYIRRSNGTYEYRTSAAALLDSATSNASEVVAPRVYGRAFVKPVPLYTSTRYDSDSTYYNLSRNKITGDGLVARPAIDCVLALCQAGATIQGVRRGGVFVGLQKDIRSVEESITFATTVSPAHGGLPFVEAVLVKDSYGTVFERVASSPAVGQYAVDMTEGATKGRLTFNASQAGTGKYTYRYNTGATANAWTAANSTTVLDAIRWLARFSLALPPGYSSTSPNGIDNPSIPVSSGIEVITGAASPWGYRQDQDTTGSWSAITGGTNPPAWAHLAGTASEGMAWAGLAHIRFEELTLDSGGKIPETEFLMDGVGGGPDCNPSDAIRDVLVNLVGIPDASVITDEGPDGQYASSFDAYAAAVASTMALNCAVTGSARDILEELLLACNADIVQLPGGRVKVLALSDQPAGDYVPCSVSYVIDETDILGDDLLQMETRERGECYNAIPVQYKDASKGFEDATYVWRDEFDSAQYGRRTGSSVSSRWITSSQHAMLVSQTLVRRSLQERRRFNFKLPPHYCLLEPGDLVTVSDVTFPETTIRILSIDENDDYSLEVEGWEWSGAVTPIDITPEVLPQAVQAAPDDLQAASEIVSQLGAQVADGKAQKDLSDVVSGSVTETLIADGAVTVAKLNVAQLSAISADLGTVTAGTLGVTGTFKLGSTPLSAALIPACQGTVYRDAVGFSYVFSDNKGVTVSAARVDRGASASPRYVVRITSPRAWSGRVYVTSASATQGVLAVLDEPMDPYYWDVGLWSLTTSAWLDPNDSTRRWRLNFMALSGL